MSWLAFILSEGCHLSVESDLEEKKKAVGQFGTMPKLLHE
jgi:hypothetical protein